MTLPLEKVSRLGIGTHLGKDTEAVNDEYVETIVEACSRGVTVIDTAVNYRRQRSEHAIETAMLHLKGRGVRRDQLFISTKGGYIPGDARATMSMQNIFRDTLLRNGVMKSEEIVDDCHCIAPAYLKHSLKLSLRNLRMERVELYSIHNPEQQLAAVDRPAFQARMRAAFAALEEEATAGRIGAYGLATWNGFRVAPEAPDHLDLERLLAIARDAGGADHHFRAIQAPYNSAMTELRDVKNQRGRSTLEAAANTGLAVFTSATLSQGKLAASTGGASAAIRFALATPGIACSLVGMKSKAHLEENLAAV